MNNVKRLSLVAVFIAGGLAAILWGWSRSSQEPDGAPLQPQQGPDLRHAGV